MKLTGFIGALNVVEEPAETGRRAWIPLLPADRGAHVLGGSVGADFVVLTLLNGRKKNVVFFVRSIPVKLIPIKRIPASVRKINKYN